MSTDIKVGDYVRILDGSGVIGYVGGWTGNMNKYVDRVVTVKGIRGDIGAVEVSDCLYIFDIRYVVKVGTAFDFAQDWAKDMIHRVIVNDPATIIIWGDGSKTVVKCMEGETFDPEKGIAMAYMKHCLFDDKSTPMHKWLHEQIPDLYFVEEEMRKLGLLDEVQ